jgi:hypothetical protein
MNRTYQALQRSLILPTQTRHIYTKMLWPIESEVTALSPSSEAL